MKHTELGVFVKQTVNVDVLGIIACRTALGQTEDAP